MSEYGKPRKDAPEYAGYMRNLMMSDKAAKASLSRQRQEILDSLQFTRAAGTLRASLGTSPTTQGARDFAEIARIMRTTFKGK